MCTHHCYITHTATPSTLTHTHLLTLHTSLRLSAHTHKHTHIQSCQAPSLLHGFRSKLCELPACSVSHTHTHPYLTDTQYTQTQRHTHPYIHIRTVRIQIHITPHHPPPHAHSYTPTATDRHTRTHTYTQKRRPRHFTIWPGRFTLHFAVKGVLKDKTYDFLHAFLGTYPNRLCTLYLFPGLKLELRISSILSILLQKANTKVQDKINKHLSLKYNLP